MAGLEAEFSKRNCKIIGLSIDSVEDHKRWAKDIEETQGHAVNYPMIGDTDLSVAKLYNMYAKGLEKMDADLDFGDIESRIRRT